MYQQGNLFEPRRAPRPLRAPVLLVELPSWRRVFLANLLDTILRVKPIQPLLSSRPAPFWPDVFVEHPIPWRRLAQSAVFHVIMAAVGVSLGEMWLRPAPQVRSAFDHATVTYYPVSDYLPPLDTGHAPAPQARHGEPAYAKQRIVSLPPLHDSTQQTVITPSKIKLPGDVSLPNLVAWNALPGPAPAEAIADRASLPQLPVSVVAPPPDAAQTTSRLVAPVLPAEVVAPPPDALQTQSRLQAPDFQVSPVAPPPDAAGRSRMNLPTVGQVSVVEPPPSLDKLRDRTRLPNVPAPEVVQPPVSARGRKLGEMNIAHLDAQVAAPKLSTPAQQAAAAETPGGQTGQGAPPEPMRIRSGAASRPRKTAPVAAPPATTVASAAPSGNAAGQMIALSLHPALPSGPVNVPNGSRYGEFAAGPEGKPDAPGTPDIKGGGNGEGSASKAVDRAALPPGISISPAPESVAPSNVSRTLLAAAMPMKVGDIARQTRLGNSGPSTADPDPINREVFGARKYYTMQLNMPNLTSAAGSWIIRFAELNSVSAPGEVTAPQVTLKVDPKYPPEARRNGVQGVVVLYAVIRKDGSVDKVRVLHGIDSQLDSNACAALQRWHFHPGTHNGSAVDLEAVVQIPFQAKSLGF